ncbi:MAG: TolC family protein, partial [Fimbriimonadales bacterium]
MIRKRLSGFVRRISGIGITALMVGSLSAQSPLTLEQAIDSALQNNGSVRSALENRVGARARLEASRASLFPSIGLSTSSTTTRIDQGGVTNETTQRQSAFSLEWLLLDNGQRDLRLRQASRTAELASQTARETVRRVIFGTARAYYDVLRRQELLQVADAQVERARTLLEVAKAQAEVGTAPTKDVFQAEADLANALVQQIQARNALRLAQSELKRLIGWEQTRPLPDLVPVDAPETLPPVENLESLWARARAQRPDLRNAELSAQVSR